MTQFPSDEEIATRLNEVRSVLTDSLPETKSHRFSRRTRVGLTAGIAGLAALGLTAGTIVVVQASQEDISYSVACYEGASTSSRMTTVAAPIAVDNGNGNSDRTATDPIETCGAIWKMGLLGQPTPPADPNTANFPVPPLVACKLANGVGAGFPRGESSASADEFCSGLGLAAWPSPGK